MPSHSFFYLFTWCITLHHAWISFKCLFLVIDCPLRLARSVFQSFKRALFFFRRWKTEGFYSCSELEVWYHLLSQFLWTPVHHCDLKHEAGRIASPQDVIQAFKKANLFSLTEVPSSFAEYDTWLWLYTLGFNANDILAYLNTQHHHVWRGRGLSSLSSPLVSNMLLAHALMSFCLFSLCPLWPFNMRSQLVCSEFWMHGRLEEEMLSTDGVLSAI